MRSILYIFLLPLFLFSSFTLKSEEKQKITQNPKIKAEIDRDSIIAYAKQYLGTPYLYAGSNPKKGFDCSGFVSYVYSNFGLTLPRSSSGYKNLGKALKPEDFKVGDILVFYGYKDRTIVGHLGNKCESN